MDGSSETVRRTAVPLATSRRLVIPCWTHDETAALIDAYREKWYVLRRGHLRASHWAEVAEGLRDRCQRRRAATTGFKTAVQCRHKIEKLRQRYRQETQRLAVSGKPISSSWVFFQQMDSMEHSGPTAAPTAVAAASSSSSEVDALRFNVPRAARSKIANGASLGGRRKQKKGSFVWEMVSMVQMMGDEFLRIEEMKMKMARDMEKMRREMELKRNKMILDSQRQLADYIRGLHEKNAEEVSPKL